MSTGDRFQSFGDYKSSLNRLRIAAGEKLVHAIYDRTRWQDSDVPEVDVDKLLEDLMMEKILPRLELVQSICPTVIDDSTRPSVMPHGWGVFTTTPR